MYTHLHLCVGETETGYSLNLKTVRLIDPQNVLVQVPGTLRGPTNPDLDIPFPNTIQYRTLVSFRFDRT